MKTGLTELVFILDKSGSMSGLEADTIGGFNSMLAKQKAIGGECLITTVLFDNSYELLHDRIDIKAVRRNMLSAARPLSLMQSAEQFTRSATRKSIRQRITVPKR